MDNPQNDPLDALQAEIPLPGQYRIEERFEDSVEIAGLSLHMAGLIAKRDDGNVVIGSAAGLDSQVIGRAYFELVERACALIARERGEGRRATDAAGQAVEELAYARVFPPNPGPGLRTSVSNGVAIHTDPARARTAALCELLERDRVLRSWYGSWPPRVVDLPEGDPVAALSDHYELCAYRFEPEGDEIAVAGVFGFPKTETTPLICGLGAAPTETRALEKAMGESLQRLAFLWGEDIPSEPPGPEATPDFHQESYLYPAMFPVLRAWLNGEHGQNRAFPTLDLATVQFADITPRSLADRVLATRAVAEGAFPLVFGPRQTLPDGPIPEHQQVHPIA
ncbi:MAG: YcaO-like family protein [Myxococcales bacterium]|nr:YcaO-like family protein [Myxococcales bacterium]